MDEREHTNRDFFEYKGAKDLFHLLFDFYLVVCLELLIVVKYASLSLYRNQWSWKMIIVEYDLLKKEEKITL